MNIMAIAKTRSQFSYYKKQQTSFSFEVLPTKLEKKKFQASGKSNFRNECLIKRATFEEQTYLIIFKY